MKRRIHTPRFRARAIALAERLGAREAAQRLGVSDSLIHTWRKRQASATTNGAAPDAQTDQLVAFVFGDIRARLEGYAQGAGLPPAVLATRVAKLLLHSARGPVLGFEHRLPAVRGGAAK